MAEEHEAAVIPAGPRRRRLRRYCKFIFLNLRDTCNILHRLVLESLISLSKEEIDELSTAIQMKLGHKKLFPRVIDEAREELNERKEKRKKEKEKQAKREREDAEQGMPSAKTCSSGDALLLVFRKPFREASGFLLLTVVS